MKIKKFIKRSLIILTYCISIGVLVYGISSVYAYLNSGADRSAMLHIEVDKTKQYTPKVKWLPLQNEGLPIDEQTLKTIEKDYLNAWFVKHIACKTNFKGGIDDYYTKNAKQNIYNIIEINSKNNLTIEATTLSHNLTLEFFSQDGQLAVLTDTNVKEYKRLIKDNSLINEINETASYKVTLLLEDGFWRIRHLVKTDVEPVLPLPFNVLTVNNIKGINYYPKESPWAMYNNAFDANVIAKDFELIKNSGLNTIRIFVPYDTFGKAEIDQAKLKNLITVLDKAQDNNLNVVVTLFDFYGDYSVVDWTLTQEHARQLVKAIKEHKAVLAWDIKNEPDLDFESRGKALVTAWLKYMITVVRAEDNNHPITIGWSNAQSATTLKDELDFVSFHYYQDIDDLSETYQNLKSQIKNKPVVITEFGLSSNSGFWSPFGNSEANQATYHKTAQTLFEKGAIQFMSWTLYDFNNVPKEVVGQLPWRQNAQKHFGFIDTEGRKKPSFKYISSAKK